MARDYRTLKLEILAETKQFVDDMKKSETQVEGFGGKLEKFGKVAAAAFAAAAAAAAAYAGKLAIDGVKAAIEDEAAQARLAKALESVTGATNTQIAAVEKQIEKMSLAFGISDEKLRPAFQRLATATGSLAEAQSGLQLALDISAATGKSVEQVSNALGKAYEGNTGALSRLGIGLSSAEIKSLGLKGTMDQLADTFGGAATTQAGTLEGQINRLKVGFDEAKESVGKGLLPIVTQFIDYVTERLIPKLAEAKENALDPIKKAFEDNKEAFKALWQFTKDYLVPLFEFTLVTAIENVGKVIGTILNVIGKVVDGIRALVNEAISAINTLIQAYNRIPFLGNVSLLGGLGGGGFNAGGGERAGGSTGSTTASTLGALAGAVNSMTSSLGVTGGGGGGGGGSVGNRAVLPMIRAAQQEYQRLNQINIAVNAPSVIDEVGFTRAVVDAMNSVERTSAGGYSALFK